jgi:formylglycine-generating enzyme required for sulfatase activity
MLILGALLCGLTLFAQRSRAEQPPPLPERRLALVIGISAYANWPALPDAATDARQLAGLLEQGGYTTTQILDPDSQSLRSAWTRFMLQAGNGPPASCIVYYRGRTETLVDEKGGRNAWLVASDTPRLTPSQVAFSQQAVRLQSLFAEAEQPQIRHLLMLFDTSFADDVLVTQRPLLKLPGPENGNPARQAIVAGDAFDPLPVKRRFHAALMQALSGKADVIRDGRITATELAVFLNNRLGNNRDGGTRPRYARLKGEVQASGEFALEIMAMQPRTARLFVKTKPVDARIRILNIEPKFKQGLDLEPGRYHLEVTADGHRQHREWIDLPATQDTTLSIALTKRDTRFRNALGMVFHQIRPGSFQMGSPGSTARPAAETTPHAVKLTRPFFMQINEVTVAHFRRFCTATGYQSQVLASGGCWISDNGRQWRKDSRTDWAALTKGRQVEALDAENLPVSCVTWQDAVAFAAWLSKSDGRTYRLPTEAQWEYACRADTTTAFAFGDCLSSESANYGAMGRMASACPGDPPPRRHLVAAGTLAANAWGLFHMHGNVSEWCHDYFGPYPRERATDPMGPASGAERVIRGGHYLSLMADCRSAQRSSFPPNYASSAVGFRLIALTK